MPASARPRATAIGIIRVVFPPVFLRRRTERGPAGPRAGKHYERACQGATCQPATCSHVRQKNAASFQLPEEWPPPGGAGAGRGPFDGAALGSSKKPRSRNLATSSAGNVITSPS